MPLSRRTLLASAAVLPLAPTLAIAQAAPGTSGPYNLPISPDFPFEKKRADILDSQIAYVDEGTGPPVVFLHGNPTSSYLWRNVIPHAVAAGYRAIAPDLIGMGDSGKPDIGYTFDDHAAHLDAFLVGLNLDPAVFVIHDWGSALGMRYARLNPDAVRALAYMEAIVAPGMPVPSLEAMGPDMAGLFGALRTLGQGERMILEGNFFVEEVLPKFGVMRPMAEAEMAAYRTPYPTPESRLPTLQWPREVPIGGQPGETAEAISANSEWLTASDIPKLLFHAAPGSLMPQAAVDWHIANVPNLETRFLGAGLHFLQEEHPEQIGRGIADWLRRIDA